MITYSSEKDSGKLGDSEPTNIMSDEWKTFHIHEEKIPVQDERAKNHDKALRMMVKMGYKEGTGLGKNAQGITKTIDMSYQLGKKGFGLKLKNLNAPAEYWDFTREVVDVKEDLKWLSNCEESDLGFEAMQSWTREGPPKHDIFDEVNFCDQEILHKVLRAKDIFDELDIMELCQARAKSNPFETIKSVFFMNRASLKIANIDAATDFMFSNIDENEHHKDHKGPFYFADVCAGPGGFSEYILWRKHWYFKGFGLTLKDDNDFKLGDSICASPVTFQAMYGKDGDGNVCSPENIIDFRDKVLHETDQKGVHFMMSDGGFSVEGNENLQEILSKNIYACQCLVALEIVRPHGHFVTKLFDIFTPFSVGLLYLLYKCFEKISIMKPNSSRPANSERYFICSNLRDGEAVQSIKKYLWNIVKRLWSLRDNSEVDVLEIVPLEILKRDDQFYEFIRETNNRLGAKQVIALEKLAAFCRNPTLIEVRQEEIRNRSLKYWQIPDNPKIFTPQLNLDDFLNSVTKEPEIFHCQPKQISNIENFNLTISDAEDWHYCCMYSSEKTSNDNIYAATGNSKSFRLQKKKWVRVKNIHLCKGTLLFGEFVKEKCTTKIEGQEVEGLRYSLHVIDALRLGDTNLGKMSFIERLKLINVYCAAVNKESQTNSVRIRPKPIYNLTNITSDNPIRSDMNGKMYSNLPLLGYKSLSEVYDVKSLLLLKLNSSQTFNSTYVLRVQIFLKDAETDATESSTLSVEDVISEIKQNKF
ncbi:unnamed protein product [Phaedon cochleariae]|uniref:Cap-specific mRNA (nucleoside-2'-O-)-methyltransferase 1 n=1 Tax=Phaedon cochleariae TaxID=80249 RepID=A0A9N9WYY8_PHACE|nr:unnamed protein product [Phaedon cochleariae]